ncbi:MAG: peroxidase-related enzyme [Phycisphaerae bacterium]|nr:peroxidase-related enzyme [Phycisphaerae bacterium]
MAFIRVIPRADAEGHLADLYRRYANRNGHVDHVLVVHSLHPATLEAHMALYAQAMHGPSSLSRVEREVLGVVVSRVNGCRYCLEHHATGLARELTEDRRGLAVCLKEGNVAGLTPREAGLAGYATKLTSEPASVTAHDIAALHAAGLSDREVLDAAQVIGYFNYVNRIVLGLGVTLEAGPIGQHPAASTA